MKTLRIQVYFYSSCVVFLSLMACAGINNSAANSPYSGPKITLKNVEAEKLPSGKIFIHWEADAKALPVAVYWNKTPDDFNRFPQPIAVVDSPTGVEVANPFPAGRPYFQLVPRRGKARVVAERRLVLDGETNFRDLGGYETGDGRSVKWGQLYRSGDLRDLSNNDRYFLSRLHLITIVDFRTRGETDLRPNQQIQGTVESSIPISRGGLSLKEKEYGLKTGDFSQFGPQVLVDANRLWVQDSMTDYGDFVKGLFHADNRPAVLASGNGKDRVGLAAAVLLWVLGIPVETIMEDYLASNKFQKEEREKKLLEARQHIAKIKGIPAIEVNIGPYRALLEARREYLQAGMDEVQKVYGSIDNYLEKGLGLTAGTRRKLQNLLLE